MKKILALILALVMIATLFAGCGEKEPNQGSEGNTIKVGLICIGRP